MHHSSVVCCQWSNSSITIHRSRSCCCCNSLLHHCATLWIVMDNPIRFILSRSTKCTMCTVEEKCSRHSFVCTVYILVDLVLWLNTRLCLIVDSSSEKRKAAERKTCDDHFHESQTTVVLIYCKAKLVLLDRKKVYWERRSQFANAVKPVAAYWWEFAKQTTSSLALFLKRYFPTSCHCLPRGTCQREYMSF